MLLADINSININTILEPPLALLNQHIIPAHHPLPHPPIGRKSPILEPITALPAHTVMCILVLIPELHSNLVVRKRKQLLAQAVVLLFPPLLGQEFDYGVCAGQEAVAVAPDGVGCVGFGARDGIPGM